MPRYFFPSSDGQAFVPDEEGVELGCLEDARALAGKALVEMAADALLRAQDGRVFRIRVLGSDNQVLLDLSLTFSLIAPRRDNGG